MKKKAQAHSQIFIYILSIIIVAVILIYGYKAISHFQTKADQVSMVKFKTDLESIIRIVGPDYGSVKRDEFIVGNDYKQLCLVDSDITDGNTLTGAHPIIKDIVSSGSGENAFLMSDKIEEKFNIGKIEISTNILCISVTRGRIRMEFEGKGDRTEIREWNYG
jgi:hypothetical protein